MTITLHSICSKIKTQNRYWITDSENCGNVMEGKWHKRKIVLFLLLDKKYALEVTFETTDSCSWRLQITQNYQYQNLQWNNTQMTFLFMGTWAYIGSSLQRDCKISWKLVGVVELKKLLASQNTTFYHFWKFMYTITNRW